MTQGYRDALLEYLSLSLLETDLRESRSQDYDLRGEVNGRKSLAREKIEKALTGRR
jgi:hypothetical protein